MNFQEWVAHWGDKRLEERIQSAKGCGERMWNGERSEFSDFSWPAWELLLAGWWDEPLDEWHRRWTECGGRFFEGNRMMAVKWDPIWEKLSDTFYDGLGNPYPPFARSSCASWHEINRNEAIVLGVITKEALAKKFRGSQTEKRSKEIIEDFGREWLEALKADLDVEVEAEELRFKKEMEEVKRAYLAQSDEQSRLFNERSRLFTERNEVFDLMDEIESLLKKPDFKIADQRMADWLTESIQKLIDTPYFGDYSNWRAKAHLAGANLFKLNRQPDQELRFLKIAISINPKLGVKRRIKALEAGTDKA